MLTSFLHSCQTNTTFAATSSIVTPNDNTTHRNTTAIDHEQHPTFRVSHFSVFPSYQTTHISEVKSSVCLMAIAQSTSIEACWQLHPKRDPFCHDGTTRPHTAFPHFHTHFTPLSRTAQRRLASDRHQVERKGKGGKPKRDKNDSADVKIRDLAFFTLPEAFRSPDDAEPHVHNHEQLCSQPKGSAHGVPATKSGSQFGVRHVPVRHVCVICICTQRILGRVREQLGGCDR